jgi:hypothetical protein
MLTDISLDDYLIDEIALGTLHAPIDISFNEEFVCCELEATFTAATEMITITIF